MTSDPVAQTGTPQRYLRWCNGSPAGGIQESRRDAEAVVAHLSRFAVETKGDLDTKLTIRTAACHRDGCEQPGRTERIFTFEPLPTGQHRATSGTDTQGEQ